MAKLSGESDFECLIPALPTVAVHPSEIMVLHLLQALTYYLLHLVSTKLVSSILSACQNSASDKSTMVELCILHVNLKLTLVSEAHPQCNTSAVMQSTVKDTDRLRVRRPAAWSSQVIEHVRLYCGKFVICAKSHTFFATWHLFPIDHRR